MLYQVVGATFNLMETYSFMWKEIVESEPVITCVFQYAVGLEPVSVNLERMIDKFKLGISELMGIWKGFLPEDIVHFLQKAGWLQKEELIIPDNVWARIIYCFAIAAHKNLLNREHLLQSLTPLYLGKVASFVIQTLESSGQEVEEKIESLCISFEKEKDFLINNWD